MGRWGSLGFCVLAVAGLMSCSHMSQPNIRLIQGAEKVQVVEYLSQSEREKLQDISLIKCYQCLNEKTRHANQSSCLNDLRNQASAMGGNIVVVSEGYESLTLSSWVSNCVDVKGVVYKSKT